MTHDLDIIARDPDGTPYRHEIVVRESRTLVLCVECHGPATYPHPRRGKSPIYDGIELVEECREIPLCRRDRCREKHLERHDRELLEQQQREAEAVIARKRSAA